MEQDPKVLRQQIRELTDQIGLLGKAREELVLAADIADHYMNRNQLASAMKWPASRLYRLLKAAGHPIREK